jgi:hypothetical protein
MKNKAFFDTGNASPIRRYTRYISRVGVISTYLEPKRQMSHGGGTHSKSIKSSKMVVIRGSGKIIKPGSNKNEKISQIMKEQTTKLEAREVMSANFVTR